MNRALPVIRDRHGAMHAQAANVAAARPAVTWREEAAFGDGKAAFGRHVHASAIEDCACGALRAENGVIGDVAAGCCFASGTEAIFPSGVARRDAALTDTRPPIEAPPPTRRYLAMIADIVVRVSGGRSPDASRVDLRAAVALVEAAHVLQEF